MTRRDFIKGMGALALIPFIPGIPKPEPQGMTLLQWADYNGFELYPWQKDLIKSLASPKWDNTGEMIIPHTEDGETTRYKVRYTVTEDGTEAEIVGEE
jgi:hypothetical protein